MKRYRYFLMLGPLLASMFVGACSTVRPPVVTPPTDPPPPVCDYRDTHIYTLDEVSRPIVGVRITQPSTGRVDTSDGAGYSHRPACGSEVYHFELDGWVPLEVDLAGGIEPHRVHLTRITPEPPPLPTHPDPVVGAIWSDRNGCFGDDNGCRVFTLWHYGDAVGRCAAGGMDSVVADFDAGAANGMHVIRMWGHIRVGGWPLSGTPASTGWDLIHDPVTYRCLVEVTNAAAERGMRVTYESGGIDRLNTDQERALMGQFNRAAHEAGAWKVAWFAPVNEPGSTHATSDDNGDNTPGHLKMLVDIARTGTPTLWHIGGTDNEKWDDPRDRFSQKFYTHPDQLFGYYHGTRALDWLAKIRRPFTWEYETRRPDGSILPAGFIRKWVDGEPFGLPCSGPPLQYVSVVENCYEVDAELIALSVAIKTFRGMSGLMSGNGVRRYQSWDRVVGWREVPWLVRQIPRDVAAWTWIHHSGESHRDKRVLAAQGEVRIDGARHADGRFAYVIYGKKNGATAQLRIDRSFTGQLCDAVQMICEAVSGQAGGTFSVPFTKGRLFVGRAQ